MIKSDKEDEEPGNIHNGLLNIYECGKTSANLRMNMRAQHQTKNLNIFGAEQPKAQVVCNCSGSFTSTYHIFVMLENITWIIIIYL